MLKTLNDILDEVKGSQSKVDANFRRFLSYKDALWWVKKGEGTLFSMERTDFLVNKGVLNKGPLRYLGSIHTDSLVFGFDTKDDDPIALLLMTHTQTVLKKINIYDLQRYWENDPSAIELLKELFDNWISNICERLDPFYIEEADVYLDSKKTNIIKADQIVLPQKVIDPEHKDEITWINISEGHASLFGINELVLTKDSGPFPLGRNFWLYTHADVKLEILSTSEAMQKKEFINGFLNFQDYVFKLTQFLHERTKNEDLKRFAEKEKLEKENLDNAFRNLGSILDEEEDIKWDFETHGSSLFKTMQLIGKEQNIKFKDVNLAQHAGSLEDKIRSICQRSHVQCRLVKLEKNFWKKDSRSLLGFLKDGGKPVAIINHNPSKYEIIDPETKVKRVLNEKTFLELYDKAYMFYEPFKDGPLKGKDIIKFCLKGQSKEILRIFSLGVLGALVSLIPPFLNEVLFNDVIGSFQPSLLPQVIIGFVLCTIVTAIFLLTRSLLTFRLMSLIDYRLESALWDRVLSLSTRFFRQSTVGNLVERMYAVSQIHQLITGSVIRILISGVFSIFYFIAMFYYNTTLSWIGIFVVLITVSVSAICIIKKAQLYRIILNFSGILSGLVIQLITGISKLRIASAENRAFTEWSVLKKEITTLHYKSQKIENVVTVVTQVMPIIGLLLIYSTSVVMMGVENSVSITVGALMAFFSAYIPFSYSVYEASNTLINIVQVVPLWDRAKVILEEEPELTTDKLSPGVLNGSLFVEKVSFKYENEGQDILHDLTMHVKPGEFIGIAGPSGSGKSTLVRILLGFEKPSQGKIYYNDQDLSTLDIRQVRKQIGVVLQNGKIFSGTIYDNIVCGGVFSKDDIQEAIKLSGFYEDLQNLPMGLHTFIQGGTSTLSGGQIQRLLIARAIIRKPKILIFDEATSALDNKNQDIVINSLEKLNATRIVIAHRLSTIKNADRIYILDKGHVAQEGTFNNLASKEGIFKTMLERQKF
jgi:NHLM bacteriocin system ABC transporter ATP-binding protein